jgi:aspartate aminotransferase-like enzyme
VKTDIEALAKITRNTPTILVVDAVSGLGCSDLQMDNWGVDVAVAGGQKGFMIPTGLAFVAISSKKTWDLVEKSTIPKYYFDWNPARKMAAKNETAWSSPASLIVGLKESLDMILAEGVDNVLARHSRLAKACRAGATALGLKLLAPDAPADGLTGVCAPEGVSGADLKKTLYKKYGINVAGGQEQLKGKIIRIAHMGYADTFDIITVIAALEMALKDLGYPVEIGKGVKAAANVLMSAQ